MPEEPEPLRPEDLVERFSSDDWKKLLDESLPFIEDAAELALLDVDYTCVLSDLVLQHKLPYMLQHQHVVLILALAEAVKARQRDGRITPRVHVDEESQGEPVQRSEIPEAFRLAFADDDE